MTVRFYIASPSLTSRAAAGAWRDSARTATVGVLRTGDMRKKAFKR